MTGDETENVPEPTTDAAAAAPAPEADLTAKAPPAPPVPSAVDPYAVPEPETVAVPDAEAAIEEFEVPPPPAFESASPPPIPEPVIPPSSSEDAGSDADGAPALRKRRTWAPNDTWTSASSHKQEAVPPTAAQKAEMRAAASRAATARDEATRNYVSPAAGGTDGASYRGWTVAIYLGLAVLFFGAIGFMVALGIPGSGG
ncbi:MULTISPECIES: hypothetical protein [unclassified Microbacterium]|uniref:hypothetical protein n=1 Tax=unclassified Microbacterium TaxID=2609290 RepID=UPI001D6D8586|nr:hypothetical protein [Microbacterium sp. Bi121]CAH0147302.1 hypothetical protein SRABI121_01162 [Microbacterium sp. Bi121]